ELEADLRALDRAFIEFPTVPMPSDALEEVWIRTSRAPARRFWAAPGFLRLAAAGLVTALSTATLYYVFAPPPPGPAGVGLARAPPGAELVLGSAAKALPATREATADRVLASKVSPAVRGHAPTETRKPQ